MAVDLIVEAPIGEVDEGPFIVMPAVRGRAKQRGYPIGPDIEHERRFGHRSRAFNHLDRGPGFEQDNLIAPGMGSGRTWVPEASAEWPVVPVVAPRSAGDARRMS